MRLSIINHCRLFFNYNFIKLKYKPKPIIFKRSFCSSEMDGNSTVLDKIVAELNAYADPKLAESWDNVGLLVEPSSPHCVNKILLTNDLTSAVMEEVLKCKADMIISYHPPIFAPLKRISQSSWKEKIIASCLENKIAVYSPHTAWDAAEGALGDSLASAFSDFSESVGPIIPARETEQNLYDVMTNKSNMECLVKKFGVQIVCSMECGIGGKDVYRIIATKDVAQDIAGIQDTIVTQIKQIPEKTKSPKGMGRLVRLKETGLTLMECVTLMKAYTGLKSIRLVKGVGHCEDTLIKTVALVAGSGGSVFKGVDADLLVTGEMFHHDLLNASHQRSSVILTNHSDSERPFLKKFKTYLCKKFPNVDVIISSCDKDPIETV